MKLLIGDNDWGITRDDMVQGYVGWLLFPFKGYLLTACFLPYRPVVTWQMYGNGYTFDPSDLASFSPFSGENYLSGPGGLFNFPVCTAAEAWANIQPGWDGGKPQIPLQPAVGVLGGYYEGIHCDLRSERKKLDLCFKISLFLILEQEFVTIQLHLYIRTSLSLILNPRVCLSEESGSCPGCHE